MFGAFGTTPIRGPDRRNDHELEFVIVIGKEGSQVSQADPLDVIAGYTLRLEMAMLGFEVLRVRKSCDSFAVLGFRLISADEITNPENTSLHGSVNGIVKQDANTTG